ncbi:PQQ-dependent sugar dehydrogenase [Deinococcus cellulosilyticus]|uniref:Pyrroloquinoline quinone-dependent pyranose dehydrogenase beta-propeller domain-containing protein n=1 Tax=Deinococcus cellulosilyticus (strain DSM 18568 / NBRC 106333 / KACC 11606 / 5516J-15) TaxID=1223518 RepID=A0A511N7F8_DEIC1|nr:PQQ-dependent sugar dehydrogenase [Deinococcus cellulosilyticus]GEM48770.1 hypothetical protein DC3_44050 [Deinococcus cellulosilyticus NBRC 106333 = KACC 11606]
MRAVTVWLMTVGLMGSASAASCGDFVALNVKTPEGYCVAIVQKNLKFPRGVLALKDSTVLVVEMGGWGNNLGAVAQVTPGKSIKRYLQGLDRPHGIRQGPDGRIYVGEDSRIIRFDLKNPAARTVVVSSLPDSGRHPLKSFVFDAQKNLVVNYGSSTDNCENQKGKASCSETSTRSLLKQFTLDWKGGGKVTGSLTLAKGLRNSMGLALHPSGTLLQAENSRDALGSLLKVPDEDLPHDELNVVQKGGFYGWPYCYDNQQNAPEFPSFKCQNSIKPAVLLPGHGAPLGIAYAPENAYPVLQNTVVVGLHGYRSNGHRIVMYQVNGKGIPSGKLQNVVWDWDTKPGQKQGAPVDISFAPDGGFYFTDDKNGLLLKFQRQD